MTAAKLLIANPETSWGDQELLRVEVQENPDSQSRGDCLPRHQRTANGHGIKTVAVYSDADAAPVVQMADESFGSGRRRRRKLSRPSGSSMRASRPGPRRCIRYGFLSERTSSPRRWKPGHRLHRPAGEGDRRDGRQDRVQEAGQGGGVNVVPGLVGEIATTDEAGSRDEIGYPVMMKARPAAAEGHAPRLCRDRTREGFEATKREGMAAFGDDRCSSRNSSRNRATSRSRSSVTSTATSST